MGLDAWGNSPRRRTTTPWKNIFRWNRAAQRAGETRRVFLGSLMDIFEEHPQLGPWRANVWQVLRELTSLTFLLLTKRPENIGRMLPSDLKGTPHLWLGTTVESEA
jgi:protein gp37